MGRRKPSAPQIPVKTKGRGVGWYARPWWKDAAAGQARAPSALAESPKAGPGQRFTKEGERSSEHYRNIDHPLDLALHRKQITEEQWFAGDLFRTAYERRCGRGKDSSQALVAPGGSLDGPAIFAQTVVDAGRLVAGIKFRMPSRSYRIVEHFCGEGMPMAEAVARVTSVHPSTVKYRMVEALEDLEDALENLDHELRALLARVRRAA